MPYQTPACSPVRRAVAAGASLATLLTAVLLTTGPAAHAAERPRHDDRSWTRSAQLDGGRTSHAVVRRGAVRISDDPATRRVDGKPYDRGTWTSPWVSPGFELTELIPSWEATTKRNALIEVRVRGRRADGSRTSWDKVARWTTSERWLGRTTFDSQPDDGGAMAVDTWRTPGVTAWRVKVLLLERADSRARAVLRRVGAVASRVPHRADVPTSRTGPAAGVELDVPAYSQMIHAGHSPQWGGGGEAWCSPTSLSMVLAFHGALPDAGDYAWVGGGHPHPWVDHAARMVYDHGYDGAGNWAFNTAWAGTLVRTAQVTRLATLRQAERLVADGLPLIVSIAFSSGELDNTPISSSNGHLLVIRGFERDGDVIVNDPAADPRQHESVRRVYDRAEFEEVWQQASGGLTYVLRD